MQNFANNPDYDDLDRTMSEEDDPKRRKNYSRSKKPMKRRSRKSPKKPGCGIAARRNRRWSW